MKRSAVFILGMVATACGPYRISYRMPSQEQKETYVKKEMHAHAIGPFLIGGGAYFFAFSQMSPALVDYTGVVDVRTVCPDGFVEMSHYHEFWQNAVAALISWGGIVNWWHPSYAEWHCVRASNSTEPPPAAPEPTPPQT